MRFLELRLLYILLPLLAALFFVRSWRKPFLAHPLVFYLKAHLRKAGLQTRLPQLCLWIGVLSLLAACLRPAIPFTLQKITRGGLQIFLVLDISSSMNQIIGVPEEMQISFPREGVLGKTSKLDAVKAAAQEFIARRPNDAIGLVVHSIHAYVVSPPTVDHESLRHYLTMVDINTLIGEGLTAIGEGLNLAYQLMTQPKPGNLPEKKKGRVIILFTDADHNYGRNPLPVVDAIGREGIRLYMVHLGLGENSIGSAIASAVRGTGGAYFDATNEQDLKRIYTTIESLEKSRFTVEHYERNAPAFSVFAFTALIALTAYGIARVVPNWIEVA